MSKKKPDLYAVTDYHDVLPIRIKERHRQGVLVRYVTELVGDNFTDHQKYLWRTYFQFLWAKDVREKLLRVFKSKRTAYSLAYQNVRAAAEQAEKEMVYLMDVASERWDEYQGTFQR